MMNLQREMNRMFDSFMRTPEEEESFKGTWSPEVDIKETPEAVIIQAELPGMKKDEIKLSIRDNTLQMSGEKKWKRKRRVKTIIALREFMAAFAEPSHCQAWWMPGRFRRYTKMVCSI